MNIALDIDGTITHCPEFFVGLLESRLENPFNKIYILTESLDINKSQKQLQDERWAQLSKYYIYPEKVDGLYICCAKTIYEVADQKGKFCKDNKIDIVFEDTNLYIEHIRFISPQTQCFKVIK